MRHAKRLGAIPIALAGFFASATPVHAQSAPGGLGDLIGARAAGGETQLDQRGYQYIGTDEGETSKWSYWWNQARRQCIAVTTADGRFENIVETRPADCEAQAHPTSDRYGQDYEDINLICFGEGDRPSSEMRSGLEWDSDERRYEYRTRTENTRRQFDTAVTLQFHGNDGRIRLPDDLVPPIHSGGSDGWWTLSEVDIGYSKITARYRINGLNKPRVEIDRETGRIEIDGIEDFRGRCEAVDEGQRRF